MSPRCEISAGAGKGKERKTYRRLRNVHLRGFPSGRAKTRHDGLFVKLGERKKDRGGEQAVGVAAVDSGRWWTVDG